MPFRLWPFSRNKSGPTNPQLDRNLASTLDSRPCVHAYTNPPIVPFPDDVAELPQLKHHALRALCGALMDGHSQCYVPGHPFCSGWIADPRRTGTLIAEVACQKDLDDDSYLVAIYLTRAISRMPATDEPVAQMDYVMSLDFADTVPDRKMVVQLLANGHYLADYGPILNPVERDYSTGRLDREHSVLLYCDPEPTHAQFTYWPSGVTEGQVVVPQFKCLMENGQWWIADVDHDRKCGQQVAGLEVADNPEHLTREITVYHAPKDS